jgi:Flp pilus assembly protein TadG
MTAQASIAKTRRKKQKGHAVLEAAFLAPWIIFLFVGAFDMGFYCYALICTENAARVAAMYTSSSASTVADSSAACTIALGEMNYMSNLVGVNSCGSLPIIVQASSVTGPDSAPASEVAVTYRSNQMIPIPGLLMGRMTVTRRAQMRVRS